MLVFGNWGCLERIDVCCAGGGFILGFLLACCVVTFKIFLIWVLLFESKAKIMPAFCFLLTCGFFRGFLFFLALCMENKRGISASGILSPSEAVIVLT